MAYANQSEVNLGEPINSDSGAWWTGLGEIELAEARIDEETGTSWEYKTHTVTLDGNDRAEIFTGVIFVRSITSCTIDGVAQTVSGWKGTEDGMVIRTDGLLFTSSTYGQNVVLTFTAGATQTAPADIQWACMTLARWYVAQRMSKAPANALSVTSEYGTVQLAQPGKYGPTSLPEVNAVLRRRCHRNVTG